MSEQKLLTDAIVDEGRAISNGDSAASPLSDTILDGGTDTPELYLFASNGYHDDPNRTAEWLSSGLPATPEPPTPIWNSGRVTAPRDLSFYSVSHAATHVWAIQNALAQAEIALNFGQTATASCMLGDASTHLAALRPLEPRLESLRTLAAKLASRMGVASE